MRLKLTALLVIFTLFIKTVFADNYGPLISRNMLYVLPTGNYIVDSAVLAALKKYWTVTPFKVLIDGDHPKGYFALFIVGKYDIKYTDEFNQLTREDKRNIISIALAQNREIKKAIFDPTSRILSLQYTMTDTSADYDQAPFVIAEAVKLFNDKVEYYKLNNRYMHTDEINSNAAVIKTKTLLIPANLTHDVTLFEDDAILNKPTLAQYRFNYKIVPLADVGKYLSDPAVASQYCVLYYCDVEPLLIFDGATNACLLTLSDFMDNRKPGIMGQKCMAHVSDIIDGLKKK